LSTLLWRLLLLSTLLMSVASVAATSSVYLAVAATIPLFVTTYLSTPNGKLLQ
jgi:hypothetical protein